MWSVNPPNRSARRPTSGFSFVYAEPGGVSVAPSGRAIRTGERDGSGSRVPGTFG